MTLNCLLLHTESLDQRLLNGLRWHKWIHRLSIELTAAILNGVIHLEYAGCYFINANSATKPGVVDASCQPIHDTSELYSGIYGRASINFYAFNANGNKGIACGLNNLQKLRDGEPLGGKSRAEDDFADMDDDDDDFLSWGDGMSTVLSMIVCVCGSITMLCWTTISVTILIDTFKNRKK